MVNSIQILQTSAAEWTLLCEVFPPYLKEKVGTAPNIPLALKGQES